MCSDLKRYPYVIYLKSIRLHKHTAYTVIAINFCLSHKALYDFYDEFYSLLFLYSLYLSLYFYSNWSTASHESIPGRYCLASFISSVPDSASNSGGRRLCNFHVISNLLLIYIYKLHWSRCSYGWSTIWKRQETIVKHNFLFDFNKHKYETNWIVS